MGKMYCVLFKLKNVMRRFQQDYNPNGSVEWLKIRKHQLITSFK